MLRRAFSIYLTKSLSPMQYSLGLSCNRSHPFPLDSSDPLYDVHKPGFRSDGFIWYSISPHNTQYTSFYTPLSEKLSAYWKICLVCVRVSTPLVQNMHRSKSPLFNDIGIFPSKTYLSFTKANLYHMSFTPAFVNQFSCVVSSKDFRCY